ERFELGVRLLCFIREQIPQPVEIGLVYAPAPTLVEPDELSFASTQAETTQADRCQIVERDFFIKVAQRLQFAVGELAAFFARLVFLLAQLSFSIAYANDRAMADYEWLRVIVTKSQRGEDFVGLVLLHVFTQALFPANPIFTVFRLRVEPVPGA